ncbi:hypothetical protein KY326_00620, partial [Candidatus Woesearchaeota archaeon]|nr:hypothetical protein [Candidatus Woesearchaeota archaeon]
RDAWVAYKRKLRNARFKLKRKFNNYLERAYKAYDQLEGQLHHARLSNKKAIRRARIAGVLGLVGLGLTAAGFFTNATKLAPKYLDVIDLLGLHDITADQGIDGWESKEDKVDTPPVTDETKAPTVTVVDYKKVKELEEQLAQYRAQEADYKKAQEQVAQLQKTLEDQKKTSDAEKEDLEGRLTARDQAVRDLQDKISRLSIDLQRYKTTADSRAAELEDIQKRMAATEEELKKKSAELAKTREKGIYITEAEYIRYEDLRVQCDDLRQKLRQERESYQKKWEAFTKVQDSLKEAQDKLIVMLEAEKKKIDLMKKNHEERVQELMERLQQAGDPTAFAEYQKKVVANYEQQITDLKAQHKRELERLALEREEDLETVRREKDAELKTKLDQIIQERESALLVVNKPVEDLGPYLSRGISQSYVARFFGGHFEEQLTITYGTSYRLFAVRQGERTFIKIICEDGTTDFRIVPEGNKKTFYSQIEAIRTHLKGISSALDDHLEKHGSLEITYSGTDIYGDIYRAVFEAEPTDGQIDDMRSVVQARVKPYVVEKLRKKLRPGKKVTLRLPKSD